MLNLTDKTTRGQIDEINFKVANKIELTPAEQLLLAAEQDRLAGEKTALKVAELQKHRTDAEKELAAVGVGAEALADAHTSALEAELLATRSQLALAEAARDKFSREHDEVLAEVRDLRQKAKVTKLLVDDLTEKNEHLTNEATAALDHAGELESENKDLVAKLAERTAELDKATAPAVVTPEK